YAAEVAALPLRLRWLPHVSPFVESWTQLDGGPAEAVETAADALQRLRAALHLPSATAVVADAHLGYDEARRRGGEAVPRRRLDEQLAPLGRMLASRGCRR